MNALRNPLVLTTLSGNQVSVLEGYINGNGRLTLRAITPTHGKITAEEIEPGVFKGTVCKGGFKVLPAAVAELRAAALAAAAQAREASEQAFIVALARQATEEAQLGVLLQWGTGGTSDRTKVNGTELSEAFLEAQLKARGIAIKTDWECYFTRTARVPKAVCDEIVAAALAQPKPEPKRPALTVQLWEPCEVCRAQPSYSTPRGHLCERCAG